jgi:hypothetical protein
MFESKAEALMREKNLKSSKGRDWIWTLVERGIASGLISV